MPGHLPRPPRHFQASSTPLIVGNCVDEASVNTREFQTHVDCLLENGLHDKQQLFRSVAGFLVIEFNGLPAAAGEAHGNMALLDRSGIRLGHLKGDGRMNGAEVDVDVKLKKVRACL